MKFVSHQGIVYGFRRGQWRRYLSSLAAGAENHPGRFAGTLGILTDTTSWGPRDAKLELHKEKMKGK